MKHDGGFLSDASAAETSQAVAEPGLLNATPAPTPAPIRASDEERVADARKRRGDYYANRLALFLKDTPARPKGGTVFLGDSISERLPLDEAFPGQNAVNRGIGGDHIPGLTERLDVSVGQLEPRRVYLLIGINDLVWVKSKTVQDFAAQYAELMDALKRAAPDAEVVCESVLPTGGKWAEVNPKVKELNALIRPLAEGPGFRFLDLHPWMADEKGELVREYTVDGIHLSLEGNLAWLECLLPREEFMNVALNLAPYRAETRSTSHAADAVDPAIKDAQHAGARGPDQLVVYTPASGRPTSKTNEWGYEVVVENGVVAKIGGNDSPIPANGFVASGHGKAAAWLRGNVRTGMKMELEGTTVRFVPAESKGSSTSARLRALRFHVLDLLPVLAEGGGRDSQGVKNAAGVLEAIHAALAKPGPSAATNLQVLELLAKELEPKS